MEAEYTPHKQATGANIPAHFGTNVPFHGKITLTEANGTTWEISLLDLAGFLQQLNDSSIAVEPVEAFWDESANPDIPVQKIPYEV